MASSQARSAGIDMNNFQNVEEMDEDSKLAVQLQAEELEKEEEDMRKINPNFSLAELAHQINQIPPEILAELDDEQMG